MEVFLKGFSDILNEALENQERTNRWLSEKTGINPTSIGDYRSGKTIPSIDKAFLIARVLNISLSEYYKEEEAKKIKAREESVEYITQKLKGGSIEVKFFPTGADLLAALDKNAPGSIDLSMAKERFPVLESLSRDGAFAVKVDHLFDCDEDQEIIVVWPWSGAIEKNKMLLFTTDPPREFYLRRVIIQEGGKLVLATPYQDSNVVYEKDIKIIGVVKFYAKID